MSKSLVFELGTHLIEVCNEYVYLGITFIPSGSFKSAESRLTSRGIKSYVAWSSVLLKNVSNIHDVKLLTKLFDTITKPVLLYGSEVWLAYDNVFKDVSKLSKFLWCQRNKCFEKVHVKFCKQTLQVSKNSVNIACLAELGRYPLLCNSIVSVLLYFKRMYSSSTNPLVYKVFEAYKNKTGDGHTLA